MVKKLMITTDGTEIALKAVECAGDIASKNGSTVYVVYAFKESNVPGEIKKFMDSEHVVGQPVKVYAEQFAVRIIEDTKKKLYEHGVTKIESDIIFGNPSNEIINFAIEKSIDMIIISHNGEGKFKELLNGSFTTKVCNSAKYTCVTIK